MTLVLKFLSAKSVLFLPVFLVSILFPFKFSWAIDIQEIKIYGYVDLEYIQANNDQGNKNGSFDSRHFNLLFDFPVNEKLIVKSYLEFEHGVDTEKDYGKLQLEYGFFEFTPSNLFKLRGGKILTPFGILNEVRDAAPVHLTVHIPFNLYSPRERGGFDFFPEYNTGIGFLGQASFRESPTLPGDLDYVFYLGNGESLATTNPFSSDDNRNKSLSGRLNLYLFDSITLGVSFYRGERAATISKQDRMHNTLGSSLILNKGIFNLMLEGAYSKFDGSEEVAGYSQTSFIFFEDYSPYYRYEYFDPDLSNLRDIWQSHILGINYRLISNVVLKAEYNLHERGLNNRGVSREQTSYNEIKAAIAVSF